MKILMLTPYVPYPPTSGGQIRTYNLVKRISKHHELTLVCFYRRENEKAHEEELKKIFRDVYFIKKKNPWTFASLLKSTGRFPLLLNLYDSKDAKALIAFLLKNEKWDVVHCEPFYIMHNLPSDIEPPILLVEHNIEYLAYKRYVTNRKFPPLKAVMNLDVSKIRNWEEKYWKRANKVIAVSEEDKKIIEDSGAKNVSVVPNGVDLNYFIFSPKIDIREKTILFIGDFKWFPNVEAATYLKERVWPEIKKTMGTKIKLLIVGKFVPNKIKRWADESIEIKENIADVRVAYQLSDILLAPIWSGGGTKYKILEAMASGCAVVTTPLGVEGMDVERNKDVLIGETAEKLIKESIRLLENDSLRIDMANNARRVMEENYSWEKISLELNSIYQSLK